MSTDSSPIANSPVEIRSVTLEDAPAIHAIYSESVLHGTASWELIPPDLDKIRRRINAIIEPGFPYFVALIDGQLAGYCYASSYRTRPGYRFTVENSIYVDPHYQRRGIARTLMAVLIDACTAQGFRQMIAVIGDSDNAPSIDLHRALGFEHVALLPAIGYKFGRWLDSVQMQLALGKGSSTLPDDEARPA